jgi:hypothetical protein
MDMNTPLTKEQELVLMLVQFRNLDKAKIQAYLKEKLDWAQVLGHLSYNRVAGLAYHSIKECPLEKKGVNREFLYGLYMHYELQTIRNNIFRQYAAELSAKLKELNIQHAFLKGLILSHTTYPSGGRASNDIDVLLNGRDITVCGELLTSLGYIQGYYDLKSNSIIPATRQEIITSRMTSGEVVPYRKVITTQGLNLMEVDLNFALNKVATGTEQAVAEFLNSSIDYNFPDNQVFRSLSSERFLIHLCVHLFKEASVLRGVQTQRDLSLYKFVDIYAFISNPDICIDWNGLIKVAQEFKFEKECYYALTYTRTFFPILNNYRDFTKTIEALTPENTEYLKEVVDAADSNNRYVWPQDLLSRFFDLKRYGCLISKGGRG